MSTVDRRAALALAVSCLALPAAGASDEKSVTERYYEAWQRKDLAGILACLHAEVLFKSPNAATQGKEAYGIATRKFLPLVERIEVRARFFAPAAAMSALDFYCVPPIGLCPTAERLALRGGLIVEDELFFDARPFEAFARARASAGNP